VNSSQILKFAAAILPERLRGCLVKNKSTTTQMQLPIVLKISLNILFAHENLAFCVRDILW
jgi:hypothetical protein